VRWQLVSADALAWQDFDGEVVVRNGSTGSTHLLDPAASDVFRLLVEAGGITAADLAARLAGDGAGQDECYASVEAVLAEFKRLGLAEAQSIDHRGPD